VNFTEIPRFLVPVNTGFEAYVLPENNALWFTRVACAANLHTVDRQAILNGILVPGASPLLIPSGATGSPAPTPDERFVAFNTFAEGKMYLAEHVGNQYVSRQLTELGIGAPSFLTPDACTLLFHASRSDAGAGGLDIYKATREPPALHHAQRN